MKTVQVDAQGQTTYRDIGGAVGNIPEVPVAMSSMSSLVKATIDAITANNPNSAAYRPESYFATPAQVDARLAQVVGAAPGALDTLEEIAAIASGSSASTALAGSISAETTARQNGDSAEATARANADSSEAS